MDIFNQKINTKQITPEEVLLVPIPTDFGNSTYYSLVKYEKIASKNVSIFEMNRLMLEELALKKPIYFNDPGSFNFDYYIVPGKSNLLVIDFDDLEQTLRKIDFLCSNNEQFQLNWLKFKNEYLEDTFKVQSPSGGLHYYFRHDLELTKRIIKAIKPSRFLSKSEFAEYLRLFSMNEVDGKKKKIKSKANDSISIDILGKAVVGGAGNVFKNLNKKGIIHPKREYKILKDIKLKTLDESIFSVLREIFEFKLDKKEEENWDQSLKKSKVRKEASSYIGFSNYNYVNLIQEERIIESLDLKTKDDILNSYSDKLAKIKEAHRRLINERNNLIDYTLDEDSIEFREEEGKLSLQIKNEVDNFKKIKKQLIKDLFCQRPDTEYIFNSLRRYEIEKEYSKREQIIYPNLLSNLGLVDKGKRSELEMAFVVNLKVRNYEDQVIYYLLQRDFSGDLKSFENPNFFSQALFKADLFKRYPEQLNYNGIWNEVILGYSLARKINYEGVFGRSGAKIRTLVETLYDTCSIHNSFTIRNKSQTHFSLGGIGSISHKTIPKYLQVLEKKKFFKEIVWEKNANGRKIYPKKIILKKVRELMALGWVKKNLLAEARYTPQDANQSFTSIKGVGARGLEIIGYIRENGGSMHRKDLYKKFENVTDHYRVIGKNLRTLKKLEILSMGEDNIYRLNSTSLNGTYTAYVANYNDKISEIAKDENYKKGRKLRKKKFDVVESRKDNCIKEKYYIKNQLDKKRARKPKRKSA